MFVSGFPIPNEANVAVAILVLPLNSALNPFLYTLNVVRDKLKAREERILTQKVERRIVHEYVQAWVQDKRISLSDLQV